MPLVTRKSLPWTSITCCGIVARRRATRQSRATVRAACSTRSARMAASFRDHLNRGEEALGKFRNEDALPEFEAALKLAKLPHERALALDGLATICFRNNENEQALALLDQAASVCLPGGKTPIDGETASALARVW